MYRSPSFSGYSSSLSPDHQSSIALDDMTQRERQIVSPSPPPSFYRRENMMANPFTKFNDPIPSSSPPLSYMETTEQRSQYTEPPPSIFGSIQLQKPNSIANSARLNISVKNSGLDFLLTLERKQKAVQNEIQLLLDAQSNLLIQGCEKITDNLSETSSNKSVNKYLQKENCPGVIPIRQPQPKQISLREARSGIKKCMEELIYIKAEEIRTLKNEFLMRRKTLSMVNTWERKILQAKQQINGSNRVDADNNSKIEKSEEDSELSRLIEEESAVGIEVQKLEEKLKEMKTRHEHLKQRITETVNRQEARLSSYRGVLRDTEAEIKEFLKNPPITNTIIRDEQNLTSLPLSRRTLDIAKELWNREMKKIQQRKERAQIENEALVEGINVWENCLKYITNFENDLRRQVHSGEDQDEDKSNYQITSIALVIKKLEKKLQTVENNSWNLLICAIGAELEAFREGRKFLEKSLRILTGKPCRVSGLSSQSSDINIDENRNDTDEDETTRLNIESQLHEDEKSKSSSL